MASYSDDTAPYVYEENKSSVNYRMTGKNIEIIISLIQWQLYET